MQAEDEDGFPGWFGYGQGACMSTDPEDQFSQAHLCFPVSLLLTRGCVEFTPQPFNMPIFIGWLVFLSFICCSFTTAVAPRFAPALGVRFQRLNWSMDFVHLQSR